MVSALCVVKVDFAPFQQVQNKIYGQANSVQFLEIDKNLGTSKISIDYPTQKNLDGLIKKKITKDEDINNTVWRPIIVENVNNMLREQLEKIKMIIVPDKITESFIKNFIDSEDIQIITYPEE